MAVGVGALAVGAVLLVASVAAWTGRWHRWSRRVLTGPLPMPITLLPGLGFAVIGAGLYQLGAPTAACAPLLVLLLAGTLLYVAGPRWWGPRWYHEQRRARARPDLTDAATALSYAALAPRSAPSSRDETEAAFGGADPLERWNATWLEHEEGGASAHAFARAGAVQGKLELFEGGLAFRAIDLEDRLRGAPTVLALPWRDITGARVVPAGAGPDGQRRERTGPRSAFARLVVDTTDGALLFEVNFAKRKAERIAGRLTATR